MAKNVCRFSMQPQEVSHREIFDRLIAVEGKVDKIDTNTKDMISAFQAAQGAFIVLEWLAKVAKPLIWFVAFIAAAIAAFNQIKIKWWLS